MSKDVAAKSPASKGSSLNKIKAKPDQPSSSPTESATMPPAENEKGATASSSPKSAELDSPPNAKKGGGSSEKENGSASKKKSTTSTGVSYVQMIHEAIVALKDVKGSSRIAISKWIQANYPATVGPYLTSRLSQALKSGEQKGRFLKLRGSYKISSQFKAAEKKKQAEARRKKAMAAAVAAKAKAAVSFEEVKQQNAEKLARLEASSSMSPDNIAKAKRNMKRREEALRKKEEEERKAKERSDILRKRHFPMEDTKLHAEDLLLGVKTNVPARPMLPCIWQLTCSEGSKLSPMHQAAARVDNLDSGSHGLVPDLLQVYHFWRGDVRFVADKDEQLVPEFTLQNLIFATNEILLGRSKKENLLPPLITHLFCATLSVLLNLNLENSDLSPALKSLFKDLHKYLYPILTPASWADICSLYMDAMQRYYSTDASYENVLPALNTDMNYLLGRSDTPLVPMTPAFLDRKRSAASALFGNGDQTNESHSLPDLYSEYLGSSQCALSRAYFKLLKSDPWMLSAEELMALLRALTDDILAFSPEVSENIAKREEEMQVLSKNKRAADMNFRKARLAFEGPKKPASKKADDSKDEKNDSSKDEAAKEDEEFKPTISKKQFEAAKKAQQKASDAYEKGIRKLVARTQPVGYDRNHNAVYCFRHDPEVLYVEEVRPSTMTGAMIPDDYQFPRCSWHIIQKTSLFDMFVGSLDTRGKREHDLSEELVGPPGAHQSLRRFLEDDVKEKAEANARRREKEALKKKLEMAKLKCDEDKGRRSGRLAEQAEEELCHIEQEIQAMEKVVEVQSVALEIDYDALTGRELMRKFDSIGGVETRRSREKKDSSKTRTTFQCSNLVSSGNIDGTGVVGMLVSEVLELEEMCQSLVPWEGFDRSGWIGKLENVVVAWNNIIAPSDTKRGSPDKEKQANRDFVDVTASGSKRRRMESPGAIASATSLHAVLTALKSPILELSSRIADMTNVEVARRDQETADDNMSVDDSDDDAVKKERLEKQWKKIVHRIRNTATRRHVQIREMLVEALAAARKAHLPQIVADLRSALLQYRPNAAGDCKVAAIKVLEANGDYEVDEDDIESDDDVEDEEQIEEKESESSSLLASDAIVITASLGGSADDATREDWIGALKTCKTIARLASLTKGFVQAATEKLAKLREEQEDLSEALIKWEKDVDRKAKKSGRSFKEFEGPSEVWANVEISNEICMAKTENYPWWPAKRCVPKDPLIAEQLSKADRCLVSLFGEMGSLRVVKNEQLKPFTGEAIQDDDFSAAKKDMRSQLDEFLAMARRLLRGLEKKSTRKS